VSEKSARYLRIANELSDPARLLEAMAAERGDAGLGAATPAAEAVGRGAAPPAAESAGRVRPAVAPSTPTERQLAELWRGLLNVEAVSVDDDFFELGGNSLDAVALVARASAAFGVDLPLDVLLLPEFTIAELAGAVDRAQVEQASAEEVARLVASISRMPDEEVRRLLAEG